MTGDKNCHVRQAEQKLKEAEKNGTYSPALISSALICDGCRKCCLRRVLNRLRAKLRNVRHTNSVKDTLSAGQNSEGEGISVLSLDQLVAGSEEDPRA